MELLGLSAEVEAAPADPCYDQDQLPCASCGKCAQACPGGAITSKGFIKERCIRYYMLSGKPMPEPLRPYIGIENGARAIVGCDICQRVCPANRQIEKQRTLEDDFTLADMLRCDQQTLSKFAELYGRNYAIRNRIIAQALLAAGNTGDPAYLEQIKPYLQSNSALVADHARWAQKKIEKKEKIY